VKDQFIERCSELEAAVISDGAFTEGPAVWVGRREIAHFDADGMLDIRLTKASIRSRRAAFAVDDRISLRPGTSDWLELSLHTVGDVDFAVSLVEEAIAANLPTVKTGPPPAGAELERRRRFH
jgi:Family of unknown function (DUF5519)